MPRPTCPPDDFENAVEDYVAGDAVETCARRWHTSDKRLTDALKTRGLFRSPAERNALRAKKTAATHRAKLGLPTDEIARRYGAGESVNALAQAYDVSRPAINVRLREAGVDVRGQTEANRLSIEQRPDDELRASITVAQEAVRGSTQTEEHRCKIAATRQERGLGISESERLLCSWLEERGLPCTPQKAVGRYNVDIGAAPVAVEILGGSWHAGKSIHAERSAYILDRDWHLVFVWSHATRSPLQPEVADYIVSLRERLCANPPSVGKYWVIRGDGEVLATGSADDDNITPVVPGYESYGNGS